MFIEVTDNIGPRLLNLNHVISIVNAASMEKEGCIVITANNTFRIKESYSQLQNYVMIYNDKSCIK